eukprot:TRINITY_DN9040_c0_g1_i3.p2 TRINITY_DN9040_c0_g1~~TRINITY_DN9040_c0_g1_i3.p2  ORF type:complete len:137 (-),score=35.44 TRINITY_DN9040_c0_g1_i3:250-660(-)
MLHESVDVPLVIGNVFVKFQQVLFFFFNDTATTEIYTLHIVGSVRCVQETDAEYMGQTKKGKARGERNKRNRDLLIIVRTEVKSMGQGAMVDKVKETNMCGNTSKVRDIKRCKYCRKEDRQCQDKLERVKKKKRRK